MRLWRLVWVRTPSGVDQEHGRLSSRCASRHIARVLLMPRGIGYDEAPSGSGEESVSNVDSNALLALGLQSVNHQREIEPFTLGAKFLESALRASS